MCHIPVVVVNANKYTFRQTFETGVDHMLRLGLTVLPLHTWWVEVYTLGPGRWHVVPRIHNPVGPCGVVGLHAEMGAIGRWRLMQTQEPLD